MASPRLTFNSEGVLPHDFTLTYEQLEASMLVLKSGRGRWDEDKLRFAADTAKPQLPMWHKYRTELYPHYTELRASGIKGPAGEDQPFPDAFRHRRDDFHPKGLIRIIRSEETP